MSKIYFATIDGDVVDSIQLKNIVKIVTGKDVYDDDSIRHFAEFCGGIAREIKHPSVKFLLEHGNKVSAVKVYRDTHEGITLKKALEAVNQIQKDMGL